MRWFLGIDPGLTGALAFYDPLTGGLEIADMPTHKIRRNGKQRQRLDLGSLANILDNYAKDVKCAIIEEVGAMPKQGVSGVFNFGFNAGCAEMAVAANFISYQLVRPQVWKKRLSVPRDKNEARRYASRIFPKHANDWPLVKHDGRAEAALLAHYLWRLHPSNPQKEIFE